MYTDTSIDIYRYTVICVRLELTLPALGSYHTVLNCSDSWKPTEAHLEVHTFCDEPIRLLAVVKQTPAITQKQLTKKVGKHT